MRLCPTKLFWVTFISPVSKNPAIVAFSRPCFFEEFPRKSFKALLESLFFAKSAIIEFNETTFFQGISLKSLNTSSRSSLCANPVIIIEHNTIVYSWDDLVVGTMGCYALHLVSDPIGGHLWHVVIRIKE